MSATHRCYGCGVGFIRSGLAFECMCWNDPPIRGRGLCPGCVEKPEEQWHERPDWNDHHLRKVHKLSPEWKEYWARVDREAPGWSGYQMKDDGSLVFFVYKGPDGQTSPAFSQWSVANNIEDIRSYRCDIIIPGMPSRMCLCCNSDEISDEIVL